MKCDRSREKTLFKLVLWYERVQCWLGKPVWKTRICILDIYREKHVIKDKTTTTTTKILLLHLNDKLSVFHAFVSAIYSLARCMFYVTVHIECAPWLKEFRLYKRSHCNIIKWKSTQKNQKMQLLDTHISNWRKTKNASCACISCTSLVKISRI